MKISKIYLVLFLLMGMLLYSCSSDDSDDSSCDTVPALAENLIGDWKVDGESSVEFKADGTFTDLADPILETSLQGVLLDQKTWAVSGTTVSIKSSNEDGTLSSTDDFEALEQDCDRIVLDLFGFEYVFERI